MQAPRFGRRQLGAKSEKHAQVFSLLKPFAEDQGGRIGLLQDVLQFLGFEPCIYRNENRPDMGQGKDSHHPFDPIGQPDCHPIPGFHSDRQQAPGKLFDPLGKLRVGDPLVIYHQEFPAGVKAGGFLHCETDRYRNPGTQSLSHLVKFLYTLLRNQRK